MQRPDRDQRTGVGRQQRMQGRHAGQGWNGDAQQRLARALRHDEDDGHHQHQADFEEQRQTDHHGHQGHHPRQAASLAQPQQGTGDAVSGTGFGHQRPQHGAQGDDDARLAEDAAGALAEGLGHGFSR